MTMQFSMPLAPPSDETEAPKRKSLMADALAAVAAGALPSAPKFPVSNYWMQAKADKLHELTVAGDIAALEAFEVTGCNTYSRALRRYREICITYLQTAPKIAVKKPRKKSTTTKQKEAS